MNYVPQLPYFLKCLEKDYWCLEDLIAEKSLEGLRMSTAEPMPKDLRSGDASL